MDECFIRDRIDELRRARGVSEARMSLDIGRTKSYIQNIRCGKSNPSLEALTDICDYFGITLGEFFDREKEESPLMHELYINTRGLSDRCILILINLAKTLHDDISSPEE